MRVVLAMLLAEARGSKDPGYTTALGHLQGLRPCALFDMGNDCLEIRPVGSDLMYRLRLAEYYDHVKYPLEFVWEYGFWGSGELEGTRIFGRSTVGPNEAKEDFNRKVAEYLSLLSKT